MSADGAADLRRRAAPSARTRHGGDAIDAADKNQLRAKPTPSWSVVWGNALRVRAEIHRLTGTTRRGGSVEIAF